MKPLPKSPAAKAKEKERRKAIKLRKLERLQKRKEKRAVKSAPKNALKQWSVDVREVGCCAICGATKNLNAHHLLPKERYPQFRLFFINGISLCPTCHKFGTYSAHRNPIWFVLWLRKYRNEQYLWCKQNMGDPSWTKTTNPNVSEKKLESSSPKPSTDGDGLSSPREEL